MLLNCGVGEDSWESLGLQGDPISPWVWMNSGSWWWTGRPGMLQFMGSQRVGHDWETELNWRKETFSEFLCRVKKSLICIYLFCRWDFYLWWSTVSFIKIHIFPYILKEQKKTFRIKMNKVQIIELVTSEYTSVHTLHTPLCHYVLKFKV